MRSVCEVGTIFHLCNGTIHLIFQVLIDVYSCRLFSQSWRRNGWQLQAGKWIFWCFKKLMQSGMYSIYSLLCSYGRIEQAETYKLDNSSKFVMFDLVKAVWLCQVHLLGHGGLFWQRSSACKGTQKSIEITKSPCKAKCADFKSNGISCSIPNKKYPEIAMVGVLNPNGLMY